MFLRGKNEVAKIKLVEEFDSKDLEVLAYATSGLKVLGSMPYSSGVENIIPEDMKGVEDGFFKRFITNHPTTSKVLLFGAVVSTLGCVGGNGVSEKLESKEAKKSKAEIYRIYGQSFDPRFLTESGVEELNEFKEDFMGPLPNSLNFLGAAVPGNDNYEAAELAIKEAITLHNTLDSWFTAGDFINVHMECRKELVHLEDEDDFVYAYDAFYTFAKDYENNKKPSKQEIKDTINLLECQKNELKENSVSHKTTESAIKFLTEELKNYDIKKKSKVRGKEINDPMFPPDTIKIYRIIEDGDEKRLETIYREDSYISEINGDRTVYYLDEDGRLVEEEDKKNLYRKYYDAPKEEVPYPLKKGKKWENEYTFRGSAFTGIFDGKTIESGEVTGYDKFVLNGDSYDCAVVKGTHKTIVDAIERVTNTPVSVVATIKNERLICNEIGLAKSKMDKKIESKIGRKKEYEEVYGELTLISINFGWEE